MLDRIIVDYVLENAKKKLGTVEKELSNKRTEEKEKYINSLSGDKEIAYRYKSEISDIENMKEEQMNKLCKEWIVNLSKLASQRHFSTHVPKYIDPSAKGVSNIMFNGEKINNGYICSSNVDYYLDSYGTAAGMPGTDFLSLEIQGKKLYQHIEQNTEISRDLFVFLSEEKDNVEKNFKKALQGDRTAVTDGNLRQVFFPISDDDYYIITPVISMPVLNSFNSFIKENNEYNFNPLKSSVKNPKRVYVFKEKNEYLEGGYLQINGLVDIPYGGTKPQNISAFSIKVRNKYAIKSLPPVLVRRKIKIPNYSFFKESLYIKRTRYSDIFNKLDSLFKLNRNNKSIRDSRDFWILRLIEEVESDILSVREEIKKLDYPYNGSLNDSEYLMLYEDEKRYESDDWLIKISEEFSRWFFKSYESVVKKPITFSDTEYRFVRDFVFDSRECFIV